MRNQIEAGDGARGGEEERQVDDEHLQPALVEAHDHGGKQHGGEQHHQRIADIGGQMEEGLGLDVPGDFGGEYLRQDLFCRLHKALGPAGLLGFEAVHVDG